MFWKILQIDIQCMSLKSDMKCYVLLLDHDHESPCIMKGCERSPDLCWEQRNQWRDGGLQVPTETWVYITSSSNAPEYLVLTLDRIPKASLGLYTRWPVRDFSWVVSGFKQQCHLAVPTTVKHDPCIKIKLFYWTLFLSKWFSMTEWL